MQKIIKQKITIIGAGAWGSALAIHLAKNSFLASENQILLCTNNPNQAKEINNFQTNSQVLPKIKFPKKITSSTDFTGDCDFLFLVIPSQNLEEVIAKISSKKLNPSCILVICTKGIAENGKNLISDKIISNLAKSGLNSNNLAILSGPNFASEVARGLPTTTSIASIHKEAAQKVINLISGKNFLAKYLPNPQSAEICGAFKNVIAIGCGLVEGLKLGENCKAALVLEGIYEIQELCNKIHHSADIVNPAGFGDIFLTCSSKKSRNFSLGLSLAKKSLIKKSVLKPALSSQKNQTYEGSRAAVLLVKFAKNHHLSLPLCDLINQILQKNFNSDEIKKMLIKTIIK